MREPGSGLFIRRRTGATGAVTPPRSGGHGGVSCAVVTVWSQTGDLVAGVVISGGAGVTVGGVLEAARASAQVLEGLLA